MSNDSERHAQDIMGEDVENKTKLSTHVKCETQLTDFGAFQSILANTQGYVKAYCEVPPGTAGPFLMATSRLLLTKVTCLKFCRRLAKTVRSQPQVVFVLYAMAERIITALYTFSNRNKNIRLAIEGDWDKIDCTPLVRAYKAFLEDVRKIDDFIDGTILPENDLYKASPICLALANRARSSQLLDLQNTFSSRKNGVDKRGGPPLTHDEKKRARGKHTVDTPSFTEDREGDIIYTGKQRLMPIPQGDGFEGSKKPCGAHYRKGSYCRYGADCKFDHTPIDNIDPYSQKAWYALVSKTADMAFNTRVKMGLDGIKLALRDKKSADAKDK